jgi:sialic acid synthase SpsE/quercetin dioxygenase-like cupin family protein
MRVILELANNHNGNVDLGCDTTRLFSLLIGQFPEFKLCWKLQYRNASTLHSDRRSKLTDRVRATMLTDQQKAVLCSDAKGRGFIAGCTPFDEASVELMRKQKFAFAKVASACINDWPLLEAVASLKLPTVVSTGGATLEQVAAAAAFFTRRVPQLTLMHCVAEYPTDSVNMRLDRLNLLKAVHPDVGLSTHEPPGSALGCRLAVAMGARTLEWHVSLPPCNAYSLDQKECRRRLEAVRLVLETCEDRGTSKAELESLQSLKRGVYARRPLVGGNILLPTDVCLQYPALPGQLTADSLSKYSEHTCTVPTERGEPVMLTRVHTRNKSAEVRHCVDACLSILEQASIRPPKGSQLTLSHHRGLSEFARTGCGQVTVINRQYCKKLIILLPGQLHPEHFHTRKDETFHVLYGSAEFTLDGTARVAEVGDVFTVPPGVRHSFTSCAGCVFEEISTAAETGDSTYTCEVDALRKTEVRL